MDFEKLEELAEIRQFNPKKPITNLMYETWKSRPDLVKAFDIHTPKGQKSFYLWSKANEIRGYNTQVGRRHDSGPSTSNGNTTGSQYKEGRTSSADSIRKLKQKVVGKCINSARLVLSAQARLYLKVFYLKFAMLKAKVRHLGEPRPSRTLSNSTLPKESPSFPESPAANLIGYAYAELGMGEHVRMTAEALSGVGHEFAVVNFDVGVASRQAADMQCKTTRVPVHDINLFHINADAMLLAYSHFGKDFFQGRYNVGYWAWELSKCPDEWWLPIEMMDEIWAPTKFIQDGFSAKTDKPVELMPLCVELPEFKPQPRSYFSLDENSFIFVFVFDAFSYLVRKNPEAILDAFEQAFPMGTESVTLVLKVMNGSNNNPAWVRLKRRIEANKRVVMINKTMDRTDLLALLDTSDSFVSLHRSEGFGRGPAEAMLLNKPVICTGYSGNMDFTKPDNSLLVDYDLIPVEEGQYPFYKGQHWADPKVETAAKHMRHLYEDREFGRKIASAGSQYIRENFNKNVIGSMYRERLNKIAGVGS
ncbi:glycosyltransferase [Solemya velum gill symbiont]|uniref:glycosyltransferase n=1 Tax=Solemya velum gill symbiont TaxID=2340 RepID=UPI000997C2C1|nr:glycosyltransferase [Solemya velum gill symbiont]